MDTPESSLIAGVKENWISIDPVKLETKKSDYG